MGLVEKHMGHAVEIKMGRRGVLLKRVSSLFGLRLSVARVSCIAAVLTLFVAACASEPGLVFDSRVDPESTSYVGHEVRAVTDSLNLPNVIITGIPNLLKKNVAYVFTATALDPNTATIPEINPGGIVNYLWDMGYGSPATEGPNLFQITHTFLNAGEFQASVSVQDTDGNVVKYMVTLVVSSGLLPNVDAGGPYIGIVGELITFNLLGSDSDGEIVKYEWDFDGNGSIDLFGTISASNISVNSPYAYSEAGQYTATARLTDSDGNQDTSRTKVYVTWGTELPVADASGPYSGNVNRVIALNGTGTDDVKIIGWEWDVDNDGIYESGSGVDGAFNFKSTIAKTFTAKLRVTDQDGNRDSSMTTITVSPNLDFEDDTDINMFAVAADIGATYAVGGGVFTIDGTHTGSYALARVNSISVADGTIDLQKTSWKSGATQQPYGLFFRVSNSGWYEFGITRSGFMLVRKVSGISGTTNITGTAANPFETSSDIDTVGTNALKVTLNGFNMSCFINGSLVAQITDSEVLPALFSSLSVVAQAQYLWSSRRSDNNSDPLSAAVTQS